MRKVCKICGFAGENIWRDNKYYCASCGSEIDVTDTQDAPQQTETSVVAKIPCPICKNEENNTVANGKCRCSLCGTEFSPVIQEPTYTSTSQPYSTATDPAIAREIAKVERKRNSHLIWGCVFLVFFWPISVYHFYKMYLASQELAGMKSILK